jgi:hypothetical protein
MLTLEGSFSGGKRGMNGRGELRDMLVDCRAVQAVTRMNSRRIMRFVGYEGM